MKKLISLLFCFILVCCTVYVQASGDNIIFLEKLEIKEEGQANLVPIDINEDGRLDVSDALTILKLAARMPFTQEEVKSLGKRSESHLRIFCDLDSDGTVTLIDSLIALRCVASMADPNKYLLVGYETVAFVYGTQYSNSKPRFTFNYDSNLRDEDHVAIASLTFISDQQVKIITNALWSYPYYLAGGGINEIYEYTSSYSPENGKIQIKIHLKRNYPSGTGELHPIKDTFEILEVNYFPDGGGVSDRQSHALSLSFNLSEILLSYIETETTHY